jgi:hypothetical protein
MNQRIADLLDASIADVRAGRVTAEQLLAAHPAEAEQLAPLLLLALRLDASTLPATDPEARARIGRRVEAGIAAWSPRRPWWRPALPHLAFPHTTHRLAIGALAAIVLLFAIGAIGIAIASYEAAPGDALYAIKQRVEPVEMALRTESNVEKQIRLSNRRLDEVEQLARRGDRRNLATAVRRYQNAYGRLLAAQASASLDDAGDAERAARLQLHRVDELRARVPGLGDQIGQLVAWLIEQSPGTFLANAPAQGAAEQAPVPAATAGPATGTATADQAGSQAGRQARDAKQLAFLDLQAAINDAERIGALTPAQAREQRVLFQNAAQLGIGGNNIAVTASIIKLAIAIDTCAARACASDEEIEELNERVMRSAFALGIPQAPLAARALPTATPAPTFDAAGTATPRLATSAAGFAPPAAGSGAPTPTPVPTRSAAATSPGGVGGGSGAAQPPPVATPPPAAAAAPAATEPMPAATNVPATAPTLPPRTVTPAAMRPQPTPAPAMGGATMPATPPPGSPPAAFGAPTIAPSATPTTPAATPTPSAPVPAIAPAPSVTATPAPTTPAPVPLATPTATPTTSPSPTPSNTPTSTPTPTPTPTPTATPTQTAVPVIDGEE